MNDGEMVSFPSDRLRKSRKPINPWSVLMGLMLVCASSLAIAQVCDAERQAAMREEPANAYFTILPSDPDSTKRILKARSGYDSFDKDLPEVGSRTVNKAFRDIETNIRGLRLWKSSIEMRIRRISQGYRGIAFDRYFLCLLGTQISVLERGSSPAPQPAVVDNASPGGLSPASARLALDVSRAVTLAKKRQADLDRARQGKAKRHQAGLEAHECLKPQPGGGVINACPYAVEYIYCVYRPTRGSDSGFMDCEKNGGGMWHIGPGPNSVGVMHTSGETTYWFACKYGPTVDKPDGGSAVDVHFQVGRGLLGRCA